jgi:hypothetical protein
MVLSGGQKSTQQSEWCPGNSMVRYLYHCSRGAHQGTEPANREVVLGQAKQARAEKVIL